jgi:hypothetical protein
LSLALLAASICAFIALAGPTPSLAESPIRELAIKANVSPIKVRGAVVRGSRDYLVFEGRVGQTFFISIGSLERNAEFSIYGPGFEISPEAAVPIFGRTLAKAGIEDDATKWAGKLPDSGKYLIVIGSSRGNATYTLTISLR